MSPRRRLSLAHVERLELQRELRTVRRYRALGRHAVATDPEPSAVCRDAVAGFPPELRALFGSLSRLQHEMIVGGARMVDVPGLSPLQARALVFGTDRLSPVDRAALLTLPWHPDNGPETRA
jgi:hypothetical protein